MAVSRQKNAAFTLVELLVVITILGMLMALLLPAVNAVRESMRRSQCKNNLHQIGDAAQQHLAAHGHFPSSGWGYNWTGDPDYGFGARQPGGWIYNSLPYLGLDMIHDKGKGLAGPGSGTPKYETGLPEGRSAAIPVLICPTRRRAVCYPSTENQINSAPTATVNKTDYAANGGSNKFLGLGPTTLACLSTFPTCSTWSLVYTNGITGGTSNATTQGVCSQIDTYFNGVSGIMSEVTPAGIPGGVSNLFFVGEKYLEPAKYNTGDDYGDNDSCLEGNDWDVNRWVMTNYPPTHDTPNVMDSSGSQDDFNAGFGSAHSAGAHFVFCDGHVQLISYQINFQTYQCLGVRNYSVLYPGFTLPETY